MSKKKNNVKISSVEIKLNNTKLKLSIEEAKELRDILNDTFPEKNIKELIIERRKPYWDWYWYPHYIAYDYNTTKTTGSEYKKYKGNNWIAEKSDNNTNTLLLTNTSGGSANPIS